MSYFLIGGPKHQEVHDLDPMMRSVVFPMMPEVSMRFVPEDPQALCDPLPISTCTYYKIDMKLRGNPAGNEFFMHSDLSPEKARVLMWELLWETAQ